MSSFLILLLYEYEKGTRVNVFYRRLRDSIIGLCVFNFTQKSQKFADFLSVNPFNSVNHQQKEDLHSPRFKPWAIFNEFILI